MSLVQLLSQKKAGLLREWVSRVLETYPDEAARFLKGQKDPFANPVRHIVVESLEGLYDGLLGERGDDDVRTALDRIVRTRAVQDFTPSQATGFVFLLKAVVREGLSRAESEALAGELREFEDRLDGLALLAFDIYMSCRERLFELKVKEIRSGTAALLGRAKCPSAVFREREGGESPH
ncbi:RsbRD N-terminal domain-containing protein [Dissulfurirhabdus thermomarina]|uniref:RsbRD N-terminal domain-containing protein n=1 Tax=Dissulfurirhabdus thermomarina TaxID=1765737 RepID=UPI002852EAFF|nr:RsbRD N-terminal domain-containing protein [Dissulfurirhabdus thermomarina]